MNSKDVSAVMDYKLSSLEKVVLKQMDLSQPLTILQLGAGMGELTHAILRYAHPLIKIVLLEKNRVTFSLLSQLGDQRLNIARNDIGELRHVLHHFNIETVDVIISQLAFFKMKRSQKLMTIDTCHKFLKDQGKMIQSQNVTFGLDRSFRRIFQKVELKWYLKGVYPSVILTATKKAN